MKLFHRKELKYLFDFFLTLGFAIFLMLKINGFFDYSAKYGIEKISCTQLVDNVMFVLDDDLHTTWGKKEEHSKGEVFDIKFRSERLIESIEITNVSDLQSTVSINIYVSQNGIAWQKCSFETRKNGDDSTVYDFLKERQANYLRLEYAEENKGFWPITEIHIGEADKQDMLDEVFCPRSDKFSYSTGLEDFEQGEFAWSAKEFSTTIRNADIQEQGMLLILRMPLTNYLLQTPKVVPYVHLYIDGKYLQDIAINEDIIQEIVVPMKEHKSDVYQIELKTNCYFVPDVIEHNGDGRKLSIGIYYIGNAEIN